LRVSIEGGGTDWGPSQLFSAYNQASGMQGLYLMIRFTGSFQKIVPNTVNNMSADYYLLKRKLSR
jgi:hypothetical protein